MKKFSEYVLEQRLEESANDKFNFKCVFLVGSGGSGKSFIGDGVFGNKILGIPVVNSDYYLEKLFDKKGLPFDFDESKPIYKIQMQEREKAKKFKNDRLYTLVDNVSSFYIDGTGKDKEEIIETSDMLRKIGYDTYMLLVDTKLDIALARNAKRKRKVPPKVLTTAWHMIQDNISSYKKYFGNNFIYINNDDYLDPESKEAEDFNMMLFKKGQKVINSKIDNPVGKELLDYMRKNGIAYLSQATDLENLERIKEIIFKK